MNNPLLSNDPLPAFSKIKPEHVEPALDKILSDNRKELTKILKQHPLYTWNNLIYPIEEFDDRLNKMWSVVNHMNAVINSKALRKAYNACLPKLSEYCSEIGQNVQLFEAVKNIADSQQFQQLDRAQHKVIEDQLRDFKLAGVALNAKDKQRYRKLQVQLSQLSTKFEENVLDATQGWSRLLTDKSDLAGLPTHAISAAKQSAQVKNLDGWLFSLEQPSYLAVMTYADCRELREEMYQAYTTRASDQGPTARRWDNSEIMHKILCTRLEIVRLLGFETYADYSLATKMAKSTKQVIDFLYELAHASILQAKEEFHELKEYACQQGIKNINAWDIAYYSEKLRQHKHNISQEELRPYFPEGKVLNGLFTIVKKLYGITIKEEKNFDTWHKDTRFFELYDGNDTLRAKFYLDLYARENKRGGAWMDECRVRRTLSDGNIQHPVAFITCNFNAPIGNDPALFTHNDVITLFHEFGHSLQHMLTKINYADVSGINGIPWDAIELASQFMENWCWQKESLQLISGHHKTGESLPFELIDKMRAAKNFQSAMQIVRQLEFSLFDFRLHMEFNSKIKAQIQKILDDVRREIAIFPVPDYNRFQHGFTHIFGGGYAAGYYSYKWAEVLSADAFSKFEEKGIFDQQTGQSFLHNILETGGSEEPLELFIRFRGREPQIEALLKQNGIIKK